MHQLLLMLFVYGYVRGRYLSPLNMFAWRMCEVSSERRNKNQVKCISDSGRVVPSIGKNKLMLKK